MPVFHRIACGLTVVLLTALIYGVCKHRLHRVCRWLTPYLGAVLVGDLALLLWADRLYFWWFWITKETVFGILKLVLAIDLGATIFAAFPGAAATVRHASLGALLLICALLVTAPSTGAELPDLAMELHPRLANGTAFLLLGVWLLALWYHVPTHRFHRAILAGLSSYLLAFTVVVKFLVTQGWQLKYLAGYGDTVGYLAMLGYWTWEAWRPEPAPAASPELLQRLQPWRHTA